MLLICSGPTMRDTCVETIFHKLALFWHSGHTVYLSCHPVHIHSLPPNQCCIFNPQVFLQLQKTLIQGWINGDLCHLNRIVCYRVVTKISSCRVNTTSTVGGESNSWGFLLVLLFFQVHSIWGEIPVPYLLLRGLINE